MKPKNFPSRKLARQIKAGVKVTMTMEQARAIRTKKDRSARAKFRASA